MTALLDEGFRFPRRVEYEEVCQVIPLEKLRKMCVVTIKFCELDERVYMAVRPFHRELNLNEAHSFMYLVQIGREFGVDRSLMKKRFSDARAKGRMPDAKLLFNDFSLHVPVLQNTFHLVLRV